MVKIKQGTQASKKIKFKFDLCGANFKKEITLKKHKKAKHDPTYYPDEKKIGKGTFGFTFNIRPEKSKGKRLRPKGRKKEDNNYTEKEMNIFKSVFKVIGKSHYQGQKRTQRLHCVIL